MNNAQSRSVESKKTKVVNGAVFVFLLLLAIFTLYPIIYILLGSFKTNIELVSGGLNIFPEKFVFDNYIQAWEMANFAKYTLNSFIIAIGVMVLSVFVSSMAGYVFARQEFPFKKAIYGLLIIFMFINVGSVSLRPLFELATKLDMNQSLLPVVIIATGLSQSTYIFLVNGFMRSVPKELDEAAEIDGCSFFGTYWRIILPVLRPALATVALLSFRSGWNEYILPLTFTMTREELRPLTVGVVALQYSGDGAAAWNILFAGSAISIIPIVVIYILLNKQFMSGTTAGAVKG